MFLKRKENGRSMIEMLGVLGIMAVITVLSISAYTMSMRNIKLNNLKSDIAKIQQYVGQLYSDREFVDFGKGGTGNYTFKQSFVDTGLMKSENAFGGYAELYKAGYEIRTRARASYINLIEEDEMVVVVANLESEDCEMIESNYSNWLDSGCSADLGAGNNQGPHIIQLVLKYR